MHPVRHSGMRDRLNQFDVDIRIYRSFDETLEGVIYREKGWRYIREFRASICPLLDTKVSCWHIFNNAKMTLNKERSDVSFIHQE